MRAVRVVGMSLVGTDADLVTVEARFEAVEGVRTQVALSGLPDAVIREGRSRLLAALEESGLALPQGRLVLNLAPAGVPKGGEGLDLPLALAAAAACGHLPPRAARGVLYLGELGIDGRLLEVPGGFVAAQRAREAGIERLVAAPRTAREAALCPGIEALVAGSLADAVRWTLTREGLPRAEPPPGEGAEEPGGTARALGAIRGQAVGKRALAVAAAGGHALLWVGPPGIGKTLLARALVELLPPPALEERLEITRVQSAAGRFPRALAGRRPFRAPHHTTSFAGLLGGGSPPRPGEITLAHGGVLFLDELTEFRREVLEGLREPLEAGQVTIARAARTVELPARFQLVAAANPCPCGYRGHPRLPCTCGPRVVRRYLQRISGPLLDRLDLRVELSPPALDELAPPPGAPPPPDEHAALEADLRRAHERRRARQGELPNARLDAEALDRFAPLDRTARRILEPAAEARCLSARALQSLRRVARTAADLRDRPEVPSAAWAEALALRAPLLEEAPG